MSGYDIARDVKEFFDIPWNELHRRMRIKKPPISYYFMSPLETASFLVDKFGYTGSSVTVVHTGDHKLLMTLTIEADDGNIFLKEFHRTYII
jgi:predicted N-acyltransferase